MTFFNDLRRWNRNRRDIANLRAMSNRELRDLGVARAEIPFRVQGK